MKEPARRQDLQEAFQQAGLASIRLLLVHSSLSSLGLVEGGADTVLDALLEVLGEEGTLLVPTRCCRFRL